MGTNNHIIVYEHESLRIDKGVPSLSKEQLDALQAFYGENGVPYYSLIHKGVKFKEYVGVLQLGNTIIEVLPKVDRNNNSDRDWQKVLINMLQAVGVFNIHAPSSSTLSIKPNSLLDLYFELYISELEYIVRQGLIKKYRGTEGNSTSLKGSLMFSKHLNKNIVHQERFYTRHTSYDKEHLLHKILFKALKLLHQINRHIPLQSRISRLLMDFPEMKDINVSEALVDRISLDRKSKVYSDALSIAKLILLNYHPNVKKGSNDVLALMFDMNILWGKFVYTCLRKNNRAGMSLSAQQSKYFWKPVSGYRSTMIPDIVINKGQDDCIVLDTKWKNLNGYNPSPEDLRQLYVYSKYYQAKKVALVYPYPLIETLIKEGSYFDESSGDLGQEKCSVISLAVHDNINAWQKSIADEIFGWCEFI